MTNKLILDDLLRGTADSSFDDGIRIDAELTPVGGIGSPVKPAIYEGGNYQSDKRWASPTDDAPTPVIVIDNTPSQANRLEEALRLHRDSSKIPEFVLDLSGLSHLPAHLPRSLSSLQFPHRNADAYLRDATLDGKDFMRTELGKSIFNATAQTCGPLVAWFPQALLYGFWQSHLGKKRQNTKHARAWVSEIIGWQPASTDTRVLGVKGDPLNLSVTEEVISRDEDRTVWAFGESKNAVGDSKGKKKKLSEIGHGQVPFTGADAAPAPVSFSRITQRATLSFAQLRRVSLGGQASEETDTAMRALLVSLALYAHKLAFGRGFALRSGAELRPSESVLTWLGQNGDEAKELGGIEGASALLQSAKAHAASVGVPLDGWRAEPTVLLPRKNLENAIVSTWPELTE